MKLRPYRQEHKRSLNHRRAGLADGALHISAKGPFSEGLDYPSARYPHIDVNEHCGCTLSPQSVAGEEPEHWRGYTAGGSLFYLTYVSHWTDGAER